MVVPKIDTVMMIGVKNRCIICVLCVQCVYLLLRISTCRSFYSKNNCRRAEEILGGKIKGRLDRAVVVAATDYAYIFREL